MYETGSIMSWQNKSVRYIAIYDFEIDLIGSVAM